MFKWKKRWLVAKGEVLAILELGFWQLRQDYLESPASLHVLDGIRHQQDLPNRWIDATRTLERAEVSLSVRVQGKPPCRQTSVASGTDPARLPPETISSTFALRPPITNADHINADLVPVPRTVQTILEVVGNGSLHIDLSVFERDISAGKDRSAKVAFSPASEPVGLCHATVFAVNKTTPNDDQAMLVHARLDDNDEELLPGMYIEAPDGVTGTQAWSLPSGTPW
ncbi:MAG: hypothetical protein IPO56_12590 [Flavobacteriales bacterium]|nr:hypothetical protein [Flavobacteriales bacterium]